MKDQNRILMLLLFVVFSLSSTIVNFVDALLLPNPTNVCTRITRPSQKASLDSGRDGSSLSRRSTTRTRTATHLAASNEKNPPKKQGRAQGVYVRPSGAIEKGSGFFVPGLEGPKVRLVIGLVLLGATAVNHFLLGDVGSFGNKPKLEGSEGFLSFSETTAVVYSFLLLFQSAIEFAKEALPETSGETTSKKSAGNSNSKLVADSNTEVLEQKWSESGSESPAYRSRVQWAAASYLSMTPTNQIMLLNAEEGVQYRLGSDMVTTSDDAPGVAAALEELSKSKGGRIALPLTHPAVTSLLGSGDEDSSKLRTVILQRITDDSCWMISSDQLLAGYTGGDLKWLGKMAGYVAESE